MLDTVLIIAAVVVAVLALGGVINFNQYVGRQFGHQFFAWKRLALGGLSVAAIVGGAGGFLGTAAGVACVAGGVATIVALATYNIHRTNLVLGIIGSSMEIALYVAAGLFGIVVALPALLVAAAVAFGRAEPTMRQNHIYHDHPSI